MRHHLPDGMADLTALPGVTQPMGEGIDQPQPLIQRMEKQAPPSELFRGRSKTACSGRSKSSEKGTQSDQS